MLGIVVFDWLFDSKLVIYFVLGVAGVLTAVAWWRTRKKYYAIGLAVVAVLLGIYVTLSSLVETASQQMEGRVREMAGSVKSNQIKAVLEKNLADDFRVVRAGGGTYDKKGFIELAQSLKDSHHVDSVDVRHVNVLEIDREKRTATIVFIAQPLVTSEQTPSYRVKAEFEMTAKDSYWQKEEWKMKSFKYFDSFVNTEQELPIP